MKLIYCAIVAGLLTGCTVAQKSAMQAGLDNVKGTNDAVASGLMQSLCGMTVGAYNRLPTAEQRVGVDALCGGIR